MEAKRNDDFEFVKLDGRQRLKDTPKDPGQYQEVQDRKIRWLSDAQQIDVELARHASLGAELRREREALAHALGETWSPTLSGEELSLLIFSLLRLKSDLRAADIYEHIRTIGKDVAGNHPLAVIGSALRRIRQGQDPRHPKRAKKRVIPTEANSHSSSRT